MLLHACQRDGYSAELLVAYRFLEAGRIPAWPFVPCAYDLVVDAGGGLYRVQVRRATGRIENGATTVQFHCHLTKQRKEPIPINEFDYLCVVAELNRIYVIPTGALACPHDPGRMVTRLRIAEGGTRFSEFINQFGIGTGEVPEIAAPLTPLKRSFWHAPSAVGQRKSHRRLSTADVEAIRQLPIAFHRSDEGAGRIPAAQVAAQFGVHVATLRNLIRGKRQDLQRSAEKELDTAPQE